MGERGTRISGGQLQRVAIGRALLKDAEILIFDEATSALDSKTEKEVQENINQVTEGKTTLIISHKLYNVKEANKIIVLSEGEKIEEGTHEELLKNNGLYAELWQKQSEEYELKQKLEQKQASAETALIKKPGKLEEGSEKSEATSVKSVLKDNRYIKRHLQATSLGPKNSTDEEKGQELPEISPYFSAAEDEPSSDEESALIPKS